MKHHCTLHLSILLLLGLIILSATASPSRVNDISSSKNEAKAEESRHQIVQRSADPKRRKPKKTRRKLTQEGKRSKKCRGGKNSSDCKKKSKSKKNEKGKRRTESPKRRKQGKKGKKTGKTNRSGRIMKERQSGVNMTSCITKLIFYSRLNEKKASAISRQVKRIKGNDKIQDSKGNKKSDFNSTKERLLSALGGNASNPTCGGQPFNASSSKSASSREFSQDTLTTLIACETEIADKCGNPTTGNASKLAELEACETLANDFKSAFSKCFAASKTLEESCTCVEAISESDVASLQKCDVSSDNSAALKAKKACKSAVGKCKTAEAAAVEGIDTCKQETKCFGVAEGSRLVAEVLTPLNEALKNPAFSNALKTAGLDTGAGADGQVPSSSRQVLPSHRQGGDGAGCTAVDEEWTKFNITGNKALASADGSIDEASANETTEILNRINARSTLVEDLQSCANETNGRQVAIVITIFTIIVITIVIFIIINQIIRWRLPSQ